MIPKLHNLSLSGFLVELCTPRSVFVQQVNEPATLDISSQLLGEISELPLGLLDCCEQCTLYLLGCGILIQTNRLQLLVFSEHTETKQQRSDHYFFQLYFQVVPLGVHSRQGLNLQVGVLLFEHTQRRSTV